VLPPFGDPSLTRGAALFGRALDGGAASIRASNSLTTALHTMWLLAISSVQFIWCEGD
jgi:hypothetical protein